MCGISGIINKKNTVVASYLIKEMNDSITHRGPDGEGFYFGKNFSLAHRRLSILDLSNNGLQPMEDQSGNVITFNGEIYNYIELKEELISEGYTFSTQTDTEVILAAYDFWGEECTNKFNGMWSFAIYDKKANLIFASRDRFGIKPFYYLETDKTFFFGSEIKQLIPFVKELKVNRGILLDYLITGIEEHSNGTFFQNIQKLPQGTNLIYDLLSHEYKIKPYYSLKVSDKYQDLTEDESALLYERQLTNSVHLRMRSDVEVGTCLSGGLDSSSITALSSAFLRNTTKRKIKAIHAKVNVADIDESNFASQVANYTKSDLIFIQPTLNDFINNIDNVIRIQEEPFGSPSIILQYLVLKEARKQNCIVMLDGQGGDETLLGYERYYPAILLKKKGISKIIGFFNSSKNSRLSQIELLKYLFYFTSYRSQIRHLKKQKGFIRSSILRDYQSDILKKCASSYSHIELLQQLEICQTQLPHLLKYEDKNSMANSVETRLPFLDYKCVELAMAISNEFKIRNGWTKNILRKAMDKHLPKEVVWRKNKLGFNAPEKEWLSSYRPKIIETIHSSQILKQIINQKEVNLDKLNLRTQWRLFNIAKWEELFGVKW